MADTRVITPLPTGNKSVTTTSNIATPVNVVTAQQVVNATNPSGSLVGTFTSPFSGVTSPIIIPTTFTIDILKPIRDWVNTQSESLFNIVVGVVALLVILIGVLRLTGLDQTALDAGIIAAAPEGVGETIVAVRHGRKPKTTQSNDSKINEKHRVRNKRQAAVDKAADPGF